MLERRDVVLGISVLAVLAVLVVMAMMALVTISAGDISAGRKSVGVLELSGTIISPDRAVEILDRYTGDDNIPAIVIRLVTPGGGVSATQEIHSAVLEARKAGKKVIASMGSVAASGGYYVAAACDTIVATPGTITGSIGVIAQFAEFSELFDTLGVNFYVRKSGEFKDTGSFAREMTEREKALVDSLVMDIYDQFVEVVAEGRGLDRDYVERYADGRIFTGRQAVELGFADMTGTYRDAVSLAGVMSGLGGDPPVFEQGGGFWDQMVARSITGVVSRIRKMETPAVSYEWR